MSSYTRPDYDAARPWRMLDDDEDFTAEHVGLVVPPVDAEASRHLKRLVAAGGCWRTCRSPTCCCTSPLPGHDDGRDRFLVVNQVRPNTGQTLFLDDVVGRSMDSTQRPGRGPGRPATGEIARDGRRVGVAGGAHPGDRHPGAVPGPGGGGAGPGVGAVDDPPARRAASVCTWRSSTGSPAWSPTGEFPLRPTRRCSPPAAPGSATAWCCWTTRAASAFTSPNAISALRRLGVTGRHQGRAAWPTWEPSPPRPTGRSSPPTPSSRRWSATTSAIVLRCIPLMHRGPGRRRGGAAARRLGAAEPGPAAGVQGRDDQGDPPPGQEQPPDHLVAAAPAGPASDRAVRQGRHRGVGAPDPLDRARARDAVPRGRRRGRLRRDRPAAGAHGGGGPDLTGAAGASSSSPATPASCPSPAATSLAVVITELLQNVVDHAYPVRHARRRRSGAGSASSSATARVSCAWSVLDDGVGHRPGLRPGAHHQPGPVDRAGSGRGAGRARSRSPGGRRRPAPAGDPGPGSTLSIPVVPRPGAGRDTASRCGRPFGRSVGSARGRHADAGSAAQRAADAAGRPTHGGACGAPPRRCRPRRRSPGWWSSANSRHGALASHESHTALAAAICSRAGPVVPTGKNRSGSVSRQDETARQVSVAVFRLRLEVSATVPPWGVGTRRQPRPMRDEEWMMDSRPEPRFPAARLGPRWELVNP